MSKGEGISKSIYNQLNTNKKFITESIVKIDGKKVAKNYILNNIKFNDSFLIPILWVYLI